MAAKQGKGGITIIDLNDAQPITVYLQTNVSANQVYNTDTKKYQPDWTSGAGLVITAKVYYGAEDITSKLTKPNWTVDGGAPSGSTTASGNVLTIKTNMTSASTLIRFTASYLDATLGIESSIFGERIITRNESGGAPLFMSLETPDGTMFRTTGGTTSPAQLTIVPRVYRGGNVDTTKMKVTYTKDGSPFKVKYENLLDTPSADLGKITVVPNDVTNVAIIECTVTDLDAASATYNAVIKTAVSLFDMSDPYFITFDTPQGDRLKNGAGTLDITANLMQGTDPTPINPGVGTETNHGWTYKWDKYENGSLVGNWANATKTNKKLVISNTDVKGKAYFVCTITSK